MTHSCPPRRSSDLRDLGGLAADDFGLELDMAGYATAGHYQVIAARVGFGAQYLDGGHTQLPQAAQRFTDKDMLDNAFPPGRKKEENGRESCRERGFEYVEVPVVAVTLNKKIN